MDKENIIISIIIVLCIAAAVAAYGLTNSNNPIFSDLSSMAGGDSSGHGLGNNSTAKTGSGSSVATTTTSSGGSGTGSGGSGSGSGGSGSGSGGGGSGSNTRLSYSEATSIANSAIQVEGAYAVYQGFSDGMWIFRIYDSEGNVVDGIGVVDATGMTERV
ncbi:endoglucanase [Methanobrevibacter sp.]|uniref:endoglucanase n=1 Tax=Methanobrevibacter sp. TaxID=66852 RepID=UPI0025FB9791|nr:endoglucanase [Methanobrevibacter sp.]MBQ6512200.1 endoglucanase [Methanobrevibacter sp.]